MTAENTQSNIRGSAPLAGMELQQPLENVFLDIMKQLSDEQKSPLDIAKNIVERTAHLVKAEICTWFRVTSDRQKLVLVAAYGTKSELVPAERIYDLPWNAKRDEDIQGLTAWLAVRGDEFSANSFPQLCAHRSHRGMWDNAVWGHRPTSELKSWFGVPLRLGELQAPKESVIGVLKVERSTDEPFTEADKYVVRLMARYVAISLEYRNRITAKFLQQVGHPLWGAMLTIINILDNAHESAEAIAEGSKENVEDLEGLKRTIRTGRIHASFVNQSMTAIRKLVLGADAERQTGTTAETDILDTIRSIAASITDLSDAQCTIFPESDPFSLDVVGPERHIVCITPSEKDAIQTIVTEFLYNALKHSRSGKRASVIVGEEDNMTAIKVRDFGKGIPDENLQHIFDEGFHTAARFAPEGVGFGLTMVRSLTQNFGWPLPEVQSYSQEEGGGVSFRILFPTRREA